MPQVTLEETIRRIRYEGWCLVDEVIPPDQVASVRDRVLATAAARPQCYEGERGCLRGIIAYDQSFAPYVADQRLVGAAQAILGGGIRISLTTGIILAPGFGTDDSDSGGDSSRGWHSDWPFSLGQTSALLAPYGDLPIHLTTLWMLSDFSSDNGSTYVVPGSHRAGNNPGGDIGYDGTKPVDSEIQATGKAGSVLAFDSRVWHSAGQNRSSEPRVTLAVRYAPWWFNLTGLLPGLADYEVEAEERGERTDDVLPLSDEAFASLPASAQPLFEHIRAGREVLPG